LKNAVDLIATTIASIYGWCKLHTLLSGQLASVQALR